MTASCLYMCSGSPDSIAGAVELLRAPPAEYLHIHHIEIITPKGDWKKRLTAFKYLEVYANEYFEDVNCDFSTSRLNFKNVGPARTNKIVAMMAMSLFYSQKHLEASPVLFIATGHHFTDQKDFHRVSAELKSYYAEYRWSMGHGICPVFLYPLKDKTSEEVESILSASLKRKVQEILA